MILYQTENGKTKIEVRLQDESVWLTQKLMAELFQTTPQNITIHLRNIFTEGELDEGATCKDFLQVQLEGNRRVERTQRFYSLDAIIPPVRRDAPENGCRRERTDAPSEVVRYCLEAIREVKHIEELKKGGRKK